MRSTNRFLGLLLVSLSTASCGGGAAPRPAGVLHISGSRLRARITDAGGGARRFDGWYDTKLASQCDLHVAEDGVYRCIPMSSFISSPPLYADSTCATPIITFIDPTSTAPFYAASAGNASTTPACGADVTTLASLLQGSFVSSWRIGAAQSVPPVLYQRDAAGGCTALSSAGVSAIYPVEKLMPSELVAVSKTRVESRGASLAVQIFDGDDGSSMIGWVFDAVHKQPCLWSWVVGATDDYRCYGVTFTSDPFGPSCTPGGGLCEGDHVFKEFDYCNPAMFTRVGATTCDDVPASEMPMVDTDLIGTGRVRLVVTRASDDTRPVMVNPPLWSESGRYKPGPFYDTERQLPCAERTMEDGTIRCLTTDVLTADAYSDPDCTNLIAGKWSAETCAAHGPAPTPQFAVTNLPSAGRLYALGTEIPPGTAYFLSTTTDPPTCEAYSLQYGGYELTPADASVFATLTTEIE